MSNNNCDFIKIETKELRDLGFEGIDICGKDMFVRCDGERLVVPFFKDELSKTIKAVEKTLNIRGIDSRTAKKFITFFSEEYLKFREARISAHHPAKGGFETDNEDVINQIKKLKDENINLSFENWYSILREKRRSLQDTAEENFPNSWPGLEFTLSVQKILNISGCTLPFAGIILSRPGGNKTLCTSMIISWPHVYYIRNFTAKAFVSHNTAVSQQSLEDIDMIPRIRFKLFLTPELTPTFSANEEDLMENLGIITSVLDGKGYISHTGARGRRGYYGNYMFVWVGAAVDIPYRVQKLLATLGPKLYFFRLPFFEKSDKQLHDCLGEDFEGRRQKVENAVLDFLKWFEICPNLVEDQESHLMKMEWDSEKDDLRAKEQIVRLGKLLGRLRGHVDIWSKKNSEHEYSEYSYSYTQTEEPSRAVTELYNLARGHALLMGRNHIFNEDVPVTAKVVLSTASVERVAVLDLLLANGGSVTLSKISRSLPMSKSTALKTMTELMALRVVDMQDIMIEYNETKQILIKPEFQWLLEADFVKLREGFKPIDTSRYNAEDDTQEERPSDLVEKEITFWQQFDQLRLRSPVRTVKGQELRDALVSGGKFTTSDAAMFMEEMVRTGRIERTDEYDEYRRKIMRAATTEGVSESV